MHVRVIQPLIPHYRLALFRKLSQIPDIKLIVCAGRSLPWVRNLQSVDTGESWQDLDHPAIRVGGTPFLWQKGLQLPRSFKKGDVLVLCGELRYLSNYPLLLEARRRGVSVVWWTHAFGPNGQIADSARISMARLCDVTLLYLDSERQAYISRGFYPDNVFAAQNAIDQDPIEKAKRAWPAERLAQFLRDRKLAGCKVLLYCGRLSDATRLAVGLRALSELVQNDPSYRFIFIGDGDCRDYLLSLSEQLRVGKHVQFLGSIYDQNLMAPWFLIAQALVFPRSLGLSVFH
ncbi:MAG: glycosyltransferase, partial [Syntrophobacteraceae bacterium]